MTTLTVDDTGRILRRAATLWPDVMRYDTPACRLWADMLDGLTPAQASAALEQWMRTSPHPPKPADLHATFRRLTAGRDDRPDRVGPPPPREQCADCTGGWITCPPITQRDYPIDPTTGKPRQGAEPVVRRYPDVVRPCSRCMPETHGKWATGQYQHGNQR